MRIRPLAALALWILGFASAGLAAAPGGSDLTQPVSINADSLQNVSKDILEARGNVRIEMSERFMTSDLVRYDRSRELIEARGSVRVSEPSTKSHFTADALVLNLSDGTALAENSDLFMEETGYRVRAKSMRRTGTNNFEAEDTVFTACDGTWPSWRVEARRLEVEIEGYVFGYGGVMYVEELPIAYLPVFVFPAKLKRQSGFMPPKVGHSTLDGFMLENRFYWVVNESADVLFGLDYRSNRGFAESVDTRYITKKDHRGRIRLYHYPTVTRNESAFDLKLDHIGKLTDRSTVDIHIDWTGDKDTKIAYAPDLATTRLARTESHVSINSAYDPGSVYLYGRFTQVFSESQETALQTIPAFGFLGTDFGLFGNLFSRSDADMARLWREDGLWSDRVHLAQGLVADFDFGGVGLTLGGGYRTNFYRVYQSGGLFEESLRQGAPWGEATLWMGLTRPLFGYINTVEPRLRFRVDGEPDGSDAPLFDQEDVFASGSAVATGLETRLYDPAAGRDVALLDLDRTLNLGELSKGMPSEREWGPWRVEAGYFPLPNLGFYVDAEHDSKTYSNGWARWAGEVAFTDPRGHKLSVREQYVAGQSRYLEVSAGARFSPAWYASYVNRFSLLEDRLIEDEAKIVYTHQCWELTLSNSRTFVPKEDKFNRVTLVSVSLSGLGKVGRLGLP